MYLRMISLEPETFYLVQHHELNSLANNPAFRALPFLDADGLFKMHREGDNSYAIIPEMNKEVIVKVRKRNAPLYVMPYQKEYSLIKTLYQTKFELCKTPKAYAVGNNPQFLVLQRIGHDFDSSLALRNHYQQNASKIGRALGEFAAFVYNEMNELVYTDFHPNNSTLDPEGKVGIIDMAALSKVAPERMLFSPLPYSIRLTTDLAQSFSYETGYQFDLDGMKRRGEFLLKSKILSRHERESYTRCLRRFVNEASRDQQTFKQIDSHRATIVSQTAPCFALR